MRSLKGNVLRGTAWVVGLRLGQRILGLISTLVLVRILTPQDFGIVAMGLAVAAIFEALSSFGFDQTIIQRRNVERSHLDSAWTINQIISFFAAALLLASAPAVAHYYKDDRVTQVLAVIAFSTAMTGIHNFVGMAIHEREFRFAPVFTLAIASRVAATVVTLSAAFIWRDYRALLAGLATLAITRTVLGFILSTFRPRWSLNGASEMLTFAKWLLLNNVITALANRGQDALVGRHLGASAAGNFSVANEVASLPTTELVMPLMRAVYPAYVRMRDDGGRLLQGFQPTLGLVALLVLPAAAGIASISDEIVLVALGSKWSEAGPILRILVILGALQAGRAVIEPIFLAVGKPWVITAVSATFVAIGLPIFTLLLGSHGLPIAGWGLVGGGVAALLVALSVGLREVSGSWLMVGRLVTRPSIACALMVIALAYLQTHLGEPVDASTAAVHLLALVPAGVVLYTATVYLLWRFANSPEGAERKLVEIAFEVLARRGRG